MRSGNRVLITGAGALSALGATPGELWNGLLAGRSGIGRVPFLAGKGIPATTGGQVHTLSHERSDFDREIASRAIDDALRSANCTESNCGFVWSTGLDTFQVGVNSLKQRSAGKCFLDLAHRFNGVRLMIASACASGTQAIGEAYRLIRNGKADRCVAGGSSVMLTPFYVIGFAALQALATDQDGGRPAVCRPFDRRRCGFALADGAGAVVLESMDSAQRRGVVGLAEVAGFGVSQDGFDLNRPCDDGAGALLSMQRALEDACLVPNEIGAVNAHATGTFLGDLAEAAALRQLFSERWKRLPVSGSKGALGHAMSAAGALETIIAAYTCSTGVVPPTVGLEEPDQNCELDHVIEKPRYSDVRTVLSTSFGMGGQNAAIILRRAPL